MAAATTNGVAMCSFTRTTNVRKNASGNFTNFDLLNSKYYVLQAFGNITNGKSWIKFNFFKNWF